MSSIIQTTFVLTGPLAGKTINLGSQPYRFQLGKCQIVAPFEQMALHARFLERNWEAYPEGHEALKEKTDGQRDIQAAGSPAVLSDLQPEGAGAPSGEQPQDDLGTAAPGDTGNEAGGLEPQGDGQAPELNTKLQKAVLSLDPVQDSHWTREGKPAMTAVGQLYGSTGITRAEVEAVAPGWTREKAKENANAQ